MKKFIAVIIAVCLALSTSITAFAQEEKKITTDELMTELQGAVDYLSKESYTVDDALELYYLVGSGAEVKNADAFLDAVKENLKANDGKLVTSNGETLTAYAAAIQTLINMDADIEDTLDALIAAFGKLDPTVLPASPYEYNVIIPSSIFVEDESFGKKLCDTMIKNYYEKGKGMNYYGFSCDNTAYLISALSSYYYEYTDVINDCLKVIESYKVDGGYCFSPEYGTEPNGDSTALALMAYCSLYLSSIDDEISKEQCDAVYNDLANFKGSTAGVYTYMNDGDNAFATADALRGIELYYVVVAIDELFGEIDDDFDYEEETDPEDEGEDDETSTQLEATAKDSAVDTAKKSPATGNNIFGVAFGTALGAAVLVTLVAKKKED